MKIDPNDRQLSKIKTVTRQILTSVILLFFASHAMAGPAKAPPNIIVVMGDDHAQWALGAYGLEHIETPNLDWLAERGVLFRNAMTPAPVCSPARASFHTGKMPSAHGVHDFLSENPEFDANWLSGETMLAERLKHAGYRTALFGKWHATTDGRVPHRGFDRWLSYDSYVDGWQNQYLHEGTVYFSSDGKSEKYTGTQAWHLTEEAVRFIDEPGSQPFFININFVEPHTPLDGLPERLVDKYRGKANQIIRAGDSSDLAARSSFFDIPDDHVEKLAQYLAAVSLIDDQVGRILDALQGRGLLRNTLLIYTSDHGMLVGQYGLYGKTNSTRPPNFYEETIRIPLIVYGPDNLLRPEQSRNELVDLLDLHATVIDYANNGKTVDDEYGPGRSLRRLLDGERNVNWRAIQFAERGNARMASDGRWKLVRYYAQNADETPTDMWYDLVHPFGERLVSIPPPPTIRGSLISAMEEFFASYETPEHSGRLMWSQPAPNSTTCPNFPIDCQ